MPPAAPGERLAAREGVLLLPRLYRGTRRGRRGSGDLPRMRAAPAARHLRGDGGTPGAGVRVLRRHPQRPAPVAVHPRACSRGARAVDLQHGPRCLRRAARHGLHAAAAPALGLRRGSAGRVDRRHPGAPRPGHLPAACPGGRRHHRRCGRLTGALRLFRFRMAAPQPGVHGRPLPSAGRRPIQPGLSRHRRRGARLAGRDLGRPPAVDRRKLDLARGGDPPGPAWSVLNRPTTARRGRRLRPAVAGSAPGSRDRRVVRRRRGRAPQRGQRHFQAVRDLRAARLGDPAPARDRRLRARRRRPRARLRRPGVQRVRPDAGAVRAALPRQRIPRRGRGRRYCCLVPDLPRQLGRGGRLVPGRAPGTASTTLPYRCTWRRCCWTTPTCASTPSTTGARGRSSCVHPTAAYGCVRASSTTPADTRSPAEPPAPAWPSSADHQACGPLQVRSSYQQDSDHGRDSNHETLLEGQVVIPEAIRKRLGLEPGTEFVVLGEDDTVVLKPIAAPSMREFDEIIAHAAHAAGEAGLRPSDIAAAIRAVRSG